MSFTLNVQKAKRLSLFFGLFLFVFVPYPEGHSAEEQGFGATTESSLNSARGSQLTFRQVFIARVDLSRDSTNYAPLITSKVNHPGAGAKSNREEGWHKIPMPVSGVFYQLSGMAPYLRSNASLQVTLRINSVDTDLSVICQGSDGRCIATDVAHSIAVQQGDFVSVAFSATGDTDPGGTYAYATLLFEGSYPAPPLTPPLASPTPTLPVATSTPSPTETGTPIPSMTPQPTGTVETATVSADPGESTMFLTFLAMASFAALLPVLFRK